MGWKEINVYYLIIWMMTIQKRCCVRVVVVVFSVPSCCCCSCSCADDPERPLVVLDNFYHTMILQDWTAVYHTRTSCSCRRGCLDISQIVRCGSRHHACITHTMPYIINSMHACIILFKSSTAAVQYYYYYINTMVSYNNRNHNYHNNDNNNYLLIV